LASRSAIAIMRQEAIDGMAQLAQEVGDKEAATRIGAFKAKRHRDPELADAKLLAECLKAWQEYKKRVTPDDRQIRGNIRGFPEPALLKLAEKDIHTIEDLRATPDSELLKLPRVSFGTLGRIKAQL
jgi:hypothetical protein